MASSFVLNVKPWLYQLGCEVEDAALELTCDE